MPDVSVVITAHDEAARIRATLCDLAQQDAAPEVLLVDDRSTDATLSEARAAGLANLRMLDSRPDASSPLTTRQQALDLGFGAARGRVILTLDADSRLSSGWATRMAEPILSGRADAVAGPVGFDGAGFLPRWQSCDAAYYLTICRWLSRLGARSAAMFGNFGFRADLYSASGGFAAIGATVTEDFAFARRLQAQGARLEFPGRACLVVVGGCDSFSRLVERTLRITRAPMSLLGAVLAVWPATLLLALLWAATVPGGAGVLVLRYAAGVGLTVHAVLRNGRRRDLIAAPFYEPFVFVLAAAAALARLRGRPIRWGGRRYE